MLAKWDVPGERYTLPMHMQNIGARSIIAAVVWSVNGCHATFCQLCKVGARKHLMLPGTCHGNHSLFLAL